MDYLRAFLFLIYLIVSAFVVSGIRWLLNQPSDALLVLAILAAGAYIWLSIQTNCFTKNPFVK